MRILCARSAGFCYGVRRAMELAEDALHKYQEICSLGPLIHNRSVVERLSRKGIRVIENLAEAGGKPVLIRSHGTVPEVFRQAAEEGIIIIDATCPFVLRVQQRALKLARDGYRVVVVGDPQHPEVKGIIGWAGERVAVVRDQKEAGNLTRCEKQGVLAQTTQNRSCYFSIIGELLGKAQETRVFDTICRTSTVRQEEAAELARRSDLMIVVGGKDSANTGKLAEICSRMVPTCHIEEASQLEPEMLQGAGVIGVTAGASTPDWIIEEVIKRMTMFGEETEKMLKGDAQTTCQEAAPECEKRENAPEPVIEDVAREAEPGQEEMMEMDLASTPRQIQQGDLISGTVVSVRDDEVLLDIGGKSEGVIPRQELSLKNISNPQEVVKVGDTLDVCVLRVDNDEGHLILSKKRADRLKLMDYFEKAMESKEELAGEAVRVVKGGLLVDVLGIRGFLPASLVERGYVSDLEKYMGKTLRLRVIEFDRNRGKVVFSQKAILQEEYLKAQKELWETIQPGETRKGTVRHLTSFGAFVDLGGVDGLLHISELSWGRVKHPSEVVQEGDEVEVYVISVDKENKKISLSLKKTQPNPWTTVDEHYQAGQVVTGTIVRLVSFGAFVELEPGVEGLVHISRLAHHRVDKPEDVVSVGQEVKVKILDVNKEEQRISLSIKDVKEVDKEAVVKKEEEEKYQAPASAGVGVNLGEMFGDLFARKEKSE